MDALGAETQFQFGLDDRTPRHAITGPAGAGCVAGWGCQHVGKAGRTAGRRGRSGRVLRGRRADGRNGQLWIAGTVWGADGRNGWFWRRQQLPEVACDGLAVDAEFAGDAP